MNDFMLGAVAMASLVAALFFWRYWRDTKDPLFLFFSSSFLLEALNRFLLVRLADWTEGQPALYVVRLFSYLLILVGVIHKNRR